MKKILEDLFVQSPAVEGSSNLLYRPLITSRHFALVEGTGKDFLSSAL